MAKVPVEDRLDIQELTHRAALFGDLKLFEKCISLWTEDGVLDESCLGTPRAEGRDAMRALTRDPGASSMHSMTHFIANHFVTTYDGAMATGLCYVWFRGFPTGDHKVEIWGLYDDIYVKLNDEWRIKSRTLRVLAQPLGIPEISISTLDASSPHFKAF